MFRADRLKTMRMRLSAAYKGVNALLMKEGAQDFRSGQKFDHGNVPEEGEDVEADEDTVQAELTIAAA